MWFKNITIFRLPPTMPWSAQALEQRLAQHPLLPCNSASLRSVGWVDPAPEPGLVYQRAAHFLIALGYEERILPAAVIVQTVKERAAELEKQQGFAPGRKQLRDLKDRVSDELRPRAFVRRRSMRAWINRESGLMMIDTASAPRAEELVSVLRNDLDELAAVPLVTRTDAREAMTEWLVGGKTPATLELDDEAELQTKDLKKTAVRYVKHDLSSSDIRQHIAGGKVATKLGLVWKDRISFVLNDHHQIKRIKSLATYAEKDDKKADGSFDAYFDLMAGELSDLVRTLIVVMGGHADV